MPLRDVYKSAGIDPFWYTPPYSRPLNDQHALGRGRRKIKGYYLVNARIILAEMWRKNIDAMKERERTRTMKGSLDRHGDHQNKEKTTVKERETHTRRPGESSV